MNKIRLFVDHTLGEAQSVPLNKDQAHYIFSVMRKRIGDLIVIFDGNNGEWLASVNEISKKNGNLLCIKQTKPQITPPDLWLYFSPLKKTRTDFIIEKATELGVRKIIPIQTEYTNADRIRIDRLNAHAREAAEQCGGTYIPKILELQKLSEALKTFPPDRKLLFCDEELKQSKVKFNSLKMSSKKMFFTRTLLKLSFFETSKESAFETFLPGKNFNESGFGVFCVCTNILYI